MNRRDGVSGIHDCGADASAYALGALEPAEADAFRAHLKTCAVCRDETDTLRGVVDALALTASPHPAPPAIRRRLLRTVGAEPKPNAARPRLVLDTGSWWRPGWVLAAAVLTVMVAVVVALAVATGPSTRVIQARVSGIAGNAQLRVADEHGELIVRHLSPPPTGNVYEVWLKPGRGAPEPAGVLFNVTSVGSAELKLPVSLRGIGQVMVSPEPAGGSPAPTHTPVIVARIS
jgi:anti-sigma-K factor RskA